MAIRQKPLLAFGVILGVLLLGYVALLVWLFDRPRWQLSATNTAAGIQIEVYKEGEVSPTYSTLLPNHQVKQALHRVTIDELPAGIGKTTHSDETLKPGRWTLQLDGIELDIMPARLIIDRDTELAPK